MLFIYKGEMMDLLRGRVISCENEMSYIVLVIVMKLLLRLSDVMDDLIKVKYK